MILIVSDNDVRGETNLLRRLLERIEWKGLAEQLDIRFANLEDVGLAANASDGEVWQTCQNISAVLLTANRAGNPGGLESIIQEQGNPESLPVFTLADPQRLLHDRDYADAVALQLLVFLEKCDELRGVGRLFLP